jgi:hypothetical protein
MIIDKKQFMMEALKMIMERLRIIWVLKSISVKL